MAQRVLNCSFDRWYPSFQDVSFRSKIVPLPKAFADYLVQDGVYLPANNSAVRYLSRSRQLRTLCYVSEHGMSGAVAETVCT